MGATNSGLGNVGGNAAGDADRPAYDVVVVGGGAAGLTAALVLARARRRVAVVDAGRPRNAPAAHMHGYLSRDGMSPADLLAVGRAEVAGYGVALIDGQVTDVVEVGGAVEVPDGAGAPRVGRGGGFAVHLAGGAALRARRVLVATGLRDELPDLPGVRERWGKDVLHCPYCHGYEVRDRPLGVLGSQPGSVHQALLLRQWSPDVLFFPHTQELSDEAREQLVAHGVRIADGRVKRIVVAGGRLRGVELVDGGTVPREAVFVAPRMVPGDALLTGLGCARGEDGRVSTDASGRTSVPGVWAVGNAVDPRAQVITAAGMGSSAAVAANHDLLTEEVAASLARHRAGHAPRSGPAAAPASGPAAALPGAPATAPTDGRAATAAGGSAAAAPERPGVPATSRHRSSRRER